MIDSHAIQTLRKQYPNHSVHEDEIFGIKVWMFYTIYPGDDPSAPHPTIEDCMIFSEEGIPADWAPKDEVERMEDTIFKRGKQR